LALLLLGSDE
jgi:hypothetical protein